MSDPPAPSNELDTFKAAAGKLLLNANTPESVEAAGRILGQVIEIEKQVAETEKARSERQKVESDVSKSDRRDRSEARQRMITLLAPLLSTAVLAGTLLLQTYQTVLTEKDKQTDQQRQRDAAEDVRWGEMLKSLSVEIKGISPGTLSFLSFENSERYGDLAKQTAQTVLLQTRDFQQFKQLFNATAGQLSWSNMTIALDIDRAVSNKYAGIVEKNFSNTPLTPEEQSDYDFVGQVKTYICSVLLPVFRSPRPPGMILDLHQVPFYNCDLSGADLSNSNLQYFLPGSVNFNDVDFRGAKNYDTVTWGDSTWWRSRSMDKDMVKFLSGKFPFNPNTTYWDSSTTQKDYEAAVQRLSQ